ncbi:hypothetical protein R6Q59_012054 [Mikania micrantha]
MRVAIVGGGLSGLASAYVLAKAGVEVVLYEKEDHLGAHAKTAVIDGIDLDLGFMVFNQAPAPVYLRAAAYMRTNGISPFVLNRRPRP